MAITFDPRTDFNGASRRRRSLEIPPPPGRREAVVVEALKTLAKKRKKFVGKVEEAIDENGITIEVTRLRDRLTKLALGDTERLLLSTAGVTEQLFYKAIEEELEGYDTDRFGKLLGEVFRQGRLSEEGSLASVSPRPAKPVRMAAAAGSEDVTTTDDTTDATLGDGTGTEEGTGK